MNHKSFIAFLCLLGFCFHQVKAQSLSELFDMALENNAQLKVLENEYLAAMQVAPQVSQRPDPELGVGVFPFPVETRLGAQFARVSAMQMLLWPGVLDAKENLAIAKAKSKYERIAAEQLELHFQIQQEYYKLYKLLESQRILQQNRNLLDALEKIALSNIESGKGSAADVLKIQLKRTELETEIDIIESSKEKPQTNINRLLQRDLDIPITISDSLHFAQMPISQDSLLIKIKDNHPMLKMFELQQAVAAQTINVNALSQKPSFGLGMDYIMVNKRTDAEPPQNGRDILQLRASVNLPLNKKKYEAKEKEEELKIMALEHQKTDLLSQFSAAINNAYTDYDIAKKRIALYQEQKEITTGAIRVLASNYSNRASRFDELLQLEMELVHYDLKILSAVVDSHLARSGVERFGLF